MNSQPEHNSNHHQDAEEAAQKINEYLPFEAKDFLTKLVDGDMSQENWIPHAVVSLIVIIICAVLAKKLLKRKEPQIKK